MTEAQAAEMLKHLYTVEVLLVFILPLVFLIAVCAMALALSQGSRR
jgi:hypothetical protein